MGFWPQQKNKTKKGRFNMRDNDRARKIMGPMIIRNLKLNYPNVVSDAKDIFVENAYEAVLQMNDGSFMLYDDFDASIRKLPNAKPQISEHDFKREFGIRLTNMMRRKGVTQYDLSCMTGISQSLISSYTRGLRVPNFYNLDKIAKSLECSVDDFRYIQ